MSSGLTLERKVDRKMNNSPYAGSFFTNFTNCNNSIMCRTSIVLTDKKYTIKDIINCSLKMLLFIALWFELVLFAIFIPISQYFMIITLFIMIFFGFRKSGTSK